MRAFQYLEPPPKCKGAFSVRDVIQFAWVYVLRTGLRERVLAEAEKLGWSDEGQVRALKSVLPFVWSKLVRYEVAPMRDRGRTESWDALQEGAEMKDDLLWDKSELEPWVPAAINDEWRRAEEVIGTPDIEFWRWYTQRRRRAASDAEAARASRIRRRLEAILYPCAEL